LAPSFEEQQYKIEQYEGPTGDEKSDLMES
jgi:hypothetical protein